MNVHVLRDTARALIAEDKGVLAMDESNATCNTRFAQYGIPQTEALRRSSRDLILTTPGLSACISGVILYDETVHQSTKDGTPFMHVIREAGMIPGIKVDTGTTALASHPGEHITEGSRSFRITLGHC